jgi:hypothetical protein
MVASRTAAVDVVPDPQARQALALVRPMEDSDVLADGKVVGRIYEAPLPVRRRICDGFGPVTAIVPAIPNRTNGHAVTREEAMAKFREAWEKAKARCRD